MSGELITNGASSHIGEGLQPDAVLTSVATLESSLPAAPVLPTHFGGQGIDLSGSHDIFEGERATNGNGHSSELPIGTLPRIEAAPTPDITTERLERFRHERQKVTAEVLDHMHPTTGLLPAATRDRYVADGHYNDAWTRDTSLVYLHLLNSTLYSNVDSPEGQQDLQTRRRIGEGLSKNLDLYRNGVEIEQTTRDEGSGDPVVKKVRYNPWESAFQQEIGYDPEHNLTYLTQAAPPIHMKIDGSYCEWFAQNQPDSWGEFLNAVGTAVELDALKPTPEQVDTIKNIANYLVNIHPDIFIASTMWEDGQVHSPNSLSNAMMIRSGLQKILPIVHDDEQFSGRIDQTIATINAFVERQFPYEKSVPRNHHSNTDLATLVAMGAGELPTATAVKRYFKAADPELGNGKYPGKRRFGGDGYYNPKGFGEAGLGAEAVWPMGHLLESILNLRKSVRLKEKGQTTLAGKYAAHYQEEGLAQLEHVLNDADTLGYYPELFKPVEVIYSANETHTRFEPNENDLLWNRALVAEACSLAERTLLPAA